MIALGNYGPAHDDPQDESQKDADATGEGEGGAHAYTVRLELDLEALGLDPSAQAYDVELRADRKKAVNYAEVRAPEESRLGDSILGEGDDDGMGLTLDEPVQADPARLRRVAPGVFEFRIVHHDFALIVVE